MSDARPFGPDELLANAGWVRRLARGLVADDAAADDVVQQTLVAAWEHPPRDGTPLRPWLARVARNFALRLRRGDARRIVRETAAGGGPRPATSPGDVVARAEAFRAVTDAVLALEPAYRDVVLLRYFDGLGTTEIAGRLGVPVETVRTRLKRAHAALRVRLDREHGDRRAWIVLLGAGDGPPGGAAPRAPSGGRGASASAVAAGVAGGLLVGKKTGLVVAAVLLVALGVWGMQQAADGPRPAAGTDGDAAVASREHPRAARTGSHEPVVATPAEASVPAGPSIRGRVVDPDGRPVAGATVAASPMPAWARFVADAKATSATADAAGAFVLPVDERVPTLRVLADAPGFGPAAIDTVRAGDDVTVRLVPAATITGTVFDPAGRPVGGARVAWIAPLAGRAALVRRAVAGADGRYRISGLPPHRGGFGTDGADSTTLTAEADGFARVFVRAPTPTAALPDTVDLYLVRGAVVEGDVVDGATGAPVAGTPVVLRGLGYPGAADGAEGLVTATSAPVLARTTSDAAGAFRFEHVPAHGVHFLWANASGARGPLVAEVRAEAPGFAPARDEVPASDDGARVPVRLVLWPAATVTGRVVDDAGRPVPGLPTFAVATPQGSGDGVRVLVTRSVPTGSDGRYRIEDVPARPDAPTTATVHVLVSGRAGDPAQERSTATVEVRAGATSDAPDVVVGRSGAPAAALRVTDEDGRPVHGATISRSQFVAEAVTDREGRARVACGAAGTTPEPVRFVVRAAGRASVATTFVTPTADAAAELTVTLAPGRRLSGRVVHPDGSPAAGLVVTAATADVASDVAFPADGASPGAAGPLPASMPGLLFLGQATTAADGSFVLGDLPPGACRLRVQRFGDGATVAGPFATDAGDVLVTVPPPAPPRPGVPLEVVVADAETRVPMTRCVVSVRGADGFETFLNAGGGLPSRWGTYVCPSIAEGACVVRVRSQSHVDAEVPFTVRAGASNRVEVLLSRGATVTGTIRVPDGVRPGDVSVWLAAEGRVGEFRGDGARAADDGRFVVRGVPPGRWRVLATAAPGTQACVAALPVTIDVPEGAGEVRADAEVVAAGTLHLGWPAVGSAVVRVIVRDAAGRTAWDANAQRGETTTSLALPPGAYEVEIRWGSERIRPFRADVVAGQVTRAGPDAR